jgi:hypothetical protein
MLIQCSCHMHLATDTSFKPVAPSLCGPSGMLSVWKLDDTILTPFSLSPMTDTMVDSLPELFLAYCTLVDSDDVMSNDDQVVPQGSDLDPVPLLTGCALGLSPSFLSRSRRWSTYLWRVTTRASASVIYLSLLLYTMTHLLYYRDGKLINRLTLGLWRALSSTLSSNHITARIHSDKKKLLSILCILTPQSYWSQSYNMSTGTLRSKSLEQIRSTNSPRGTVTQVELSSWHRSIYRSQANRSRSTDNQ